MPTWPKWPTSKSMGSTKTSATRLREECLKADLIACNTLMKAHHGFGEFDRDYHRLPNQICAPQDDSEVNPAHYHLQV